MTDYSVIRFLDESLGRIAPTELVKLLHRKKFVPISAKDLPEGNVKVKWQQSFSTGSFSEDGYYESEIFALAGSVKTAQAKAAELGIKLHPNPLLALPSAGGSPESSDKPRSRKCKNSSSEGKDRKNEVKKDRKSEDKKDRKSEDKKDRKSEDKKDRKSEDKKDRKSEDQKDRKSVDKQDVKSEDNKDGKSEDKKDGKREDKKDGKSEDKKDGKSEDKKGGKTEVQKGGKKELEKDGKDANPKHKRSHSLVSVEKNDTKKKRLRMTSVSLMRTSAQALVASSSNPLLKDEIETVENAEIDMDCDDPDSQMLGCSPGSVSDDSGNDLDATVPLTNTENDIHPVMSKQSLSNLDAEKHLDNEVRDLEIPSSSSESSTSSSDSEDSEDTVSKLSKEKDQLLYDVKRLKEALDDAKRNMTLSNNVRLAQKNELIKVKKELEEKSKMVDSLLKRNNALQDVLSSKLEGSTKPKKSSSLMSTPKKSRKDISPWKCTPGSDSPSKESSTPVRGFSTSLNMFSTPRKDFDSSKVKNELDFDKSESPIISSPEPSQLSSVSNKKKKKSKDDKDILNNPEVCKVSDTLLKHLDGSKLLVPDEKGFVSLGSVKIDKSSLERNLREYKGDVQKLSKAMASLAWTVSQREERSLEGGKNNRFPNAPAKKAATPSKVNTCLGVLKAHLLNLGDTEGAGMSQNLKQARKALGHKFAQDGAQAKKRVD